MADSTEVRAMERALELAEGGRGRTFPNPMVGAVVLSPRGEVLGEGCHRCCGGPHAEVEALRDAGDRARGSTVVVTLEPCCHTGRTGPCTEELIGAGVSRVVVAMEDPNPEVCGRGIRRLRSRGLDVEVGPLADRAAELNRAYLHFLRTGRSLVVLKMASTLDGRVAAADGSSRWITGPEAREAVHRMRSRSDCVMVGSGTVRRDDPRLTVRLQGYDPAGGPLRLAVAGPGGIPRDALMLGDGPRSVVALPATAPPEVVAGMEGAGAEVWRLPEEGGTVVLPALLTRMAKEGVGETLCEGGPSLATALLRAELADRGAFFVAPKLLGGTGRPALGDLGTGSVDRALCMENVRVGVLGSDALLEGELVYGAD
jgi:diaminohydroxyphosphoribosylaminopyrimidine deaminase/5-amino-6-(5-phosphoribosylamino)uracil reductase